MGDRLGNACVDSFFIFTISTNKIFIKQKQIDNFDSYETPNLESFKEDPIQEEERKEEHLGDFDPSLN